MSRDMKIIYVTDLHGCEWKYAKTFDAAARLGASAVVNGGDMYPKNIELTRQNEFIEGYLDLHLMRYDEAGIAFLCMPGNDDLVAFDPLLAHVCGRHPATRLIAGRRVELGPYDVIGFNLVTDYPFRLKDRCRLDDEESAIGFQYGPGLVSNGEWPAFKGFTTLEDRPRYARSLPTIGQELAKLPKLSRLNESGESSDSRGPRDAARTVYVIHDPPAGLGLDVCGHGAKVGSSSVREFILERGPMLTLHGHIHESPRETGTWKARLGDTTCVQPGQLSMLTYVVIDIESDSDSGSEAMNLERVEEGNHR